MQRRAARVSQPRLSGPVQEINDPFLLLLLRIGDLAGIRRKPVLPVISQYEFLLFPVIPIQRQHTLRSFRNHASLFRFYPLSAISANTQTVPPDRMPQTNRFFPYRLFFRTGSRNLRQFFQLLEAVNTFRLPDKNFLSPPVPFQYQLLIRQENDRRLGISAIQPPGPAVENEQISLPMRMLQIHHILMIGRIVRHNPVALAEVFRQASSPRY